MNNTLFDMKINLICKVKNNLFIWRFYSFLISILEVINFYYNHNNFLSVLLIFIMFFHNKEK